MSRHGVDQARVEPGVMGCAGEQVILIYQLSNSPRPDPHSLLPINLLFTGLPCTFKMKDN